MAGMFIRYFVEIPAPQADVERLLLESPAAAVAEPARRADAEGVRLMTEVGFGLPPLRLTRPVGVRFGEPIRYPSKTLLPMTWKPMSLEALTPELDADVEVAGLGPWRTQLSISARYTPPLGPLGRSLDRALLHRVAEATLRDFLDRVAARLQTMISGTGGTAPIDVGASSA